MTATAKLASGQKTVSIHLTLHKSNLLLSIENPYDGAVRMEKGLPRNDAAGHGFGVRSIEMLTKKHAGYCSFTAQGGLFAMKVVLPLGTPENL